MKIYEGEGHSVILEGKGKSASVNVKNIMIPCINVSVLDAEGNEVDSYERALPPSVRKFLADESDSAYYVRSKQIRERIFDAVAFQAWDRPINLISFRRKLSAYIDADTFSTIPTPTAKLVDTALKHLLGKGADKCPCGKVFAKRTKRCLSCGSRVCASCFESNYCTTCFNFFLDEGCSSGSEIDELLENLV